jgi:hypothetical protein
MRLAVTTGKHKEIVKTTKIIANLKKIRIFGKLEILNFRGHRGWDDDKIDHVCHNCDSRHYDYIVRVKIENHNPAGEPHGQADHVKK